MEAGTRTVFRQLVLIGAVATLPSLVHAQAHVTGDILEGLVEDESGAVLPGVEVTATRIDTNASRSVSSGTNGRYRIPALDPGSYRVDAGCGGKKINIDYDHQASFAQYKTFA